jgi:hypothetical protein
MLIYFKINHRSRQKGVILTKNYNLLEFIRREKMKKIAIVSLWISEQHSNESNQALEEKIKEDIERKEFPWLEKIEKVTVLEAPLK